MAITRRDRVGRTRERLAELLNVAIPDAEFYPEDLRSNNPYYSSRYFDGCSWDGDGRRLTDGLGIHVSSWSTMRECVRYGLDVGMEDGPFSWAVESLPPPKPALKPYRCRWECGKNYETSRKQHRHESRIHGQVWTAVRSMNR